MTNAYILNPKAYARIPEEYLKDISKTDYETVQKARAEAKKKAAETWKKAQKEKRDQRKKAPAATSGAEKK